MRVGCWVGVGSGACWTWPRAWPSRRPWAACVRGSSRGTRRACVACRAPCCRSSGSRATAASDESTPTTASVSGSVVAKVGKLTWVNKSLTLRCKLVGVLQWFVLFCYKIKPKIPLYFGIKSRIFSASIESPRYGRLQFLQYTGSQTPHSCCSLANEVKHIHCKQVWACPCMTPKVSFSVEGSRWGPGPQPNRPT